MRATRSLVLLGVALVALLVVAATASAYPTRDIPYDGSPDLKGMPSPFQVFDNGVPSGPLADGLAQHEGRDPNLVLTLYDQSSDPSHAGPYQVSFWKEYVGVHSDVYVAWNDLAAPPTSTQQDQTVMPEQVSYVGREFDNKIWASDVFHFGWYDSRAPEGSTIDGKRAAILVYNIRDDAYWTSYRFYIAGYFWGSLNDQIGLNAIFVDSYNWQDRLGVNTERPDLSYLYEGTVAHEFEHLIHNDTDFDEDSFIDEGLAEVAMQFIYGPSVTSSEIGQYLYYHRDSLTDWKGELFDYGDSCIWQTYLWERNGGGDVDASFESRVKAGYDPFVEDVNKFTDPGDAFTWKLIHEQANGMAGVAAQVGGAAKLEALHRDWTLANLLDGKVSEPAWNYRNLALGGPDSVGISIADGLKYYATDVGGNMPPTRKNVYRRAETEPWGAYYRQFYGSAPGLTMTFTGPKTDGVSAVAGSMEWYTGLGNQLDTTVSRTIDGVTAGSTLTFQTWFDIEDQWDYGYVEASTDGTTWVKLQQVTTLPTATANINGSSAWDGAGGFTGNSAGWQPAEFSFGDLSGTVQIRFRYRTDEAANGAGWYVDDVKAGSFADTDTDAGWTNDGWLWTNGLQNNDWTVDAYVPWAKASGKTYAVVPVVGLTGQGSDGSKWLATQYQKQFRITAVMSNRPDGVFNSLGRVTVKKGR